MRTSDLNGWRVRPDYKKGVSREVYEQVGVRQDVRAGDILFVAHGTYLVGTVAVVTDEDLPLVLQDHVFRLRLRPDAEAQGAGPVDTWLALAALSTRFVRRQVRVRQFSADIIDKIGERHVELRLPIPRDAERRKAASEAVREVVVGQGIARREVSSLLGSDMRMTRERAAARHGFSVPCTALAKRVLIPKYYDPTLRGDLDAEEARLAARWLPIGELVSAGVLGAETGVEVGKMAYGTGPIPFLRTTDIAELEIKADPRQGVSRAIYDEHAARASVAEGDVLLVRDGTYLVGSSALAGADDAPALVCGGIYRLRTRDREALSPAKLLGLLNLPLVRRQMRSKQFTRDVIDTLGKRLLEVRVPDPSSPFAASIGAGMEAQMLAKALLRRRLAETVRSLEPAPPAASRGRPGWSMRG
ncbi:restriction endonuclease subunit S domain-containing protein [Roseococcus microcysteis]|uniref:hypothetical protein n=1 Tax=Roseococcus microcysteis TaxID=2771361 RepID=UPI00168AB6C0|nr:hypothetical protein [Roseococcus microcysteis]